MKSTIELGRIYRTWIVLGGSSQDLFQWSISMVIISPQDLGLWDLLQMAFFMAYKWGLPTTGTD